LIKEERPLGGIWRNVVDGRTDVAFVGKGDQRMMMNVARLFLAEEDPLFPLIQVGTRDCSYRRSAD